MSPEELQRLRSVYDSVQVPTSQPQKKKKGFMVDQISTAGGILGGLAGLPLGIIGAGGGAAVGSGLGEAIENIITGDDLGKNVVKETAIGGVLGAGPGRLLKSGLALKGGGKIEQVGSNLRRSVANTGKVADSYTDELKILETMQRRNLHGSGQKLYQNVDSELGKISKEIEDILKLEPKITARKPLLNTLRQSVTDTVPDDPAYIRELNRALSRIEKSSSSKIDARELFMHKQEVGDRLGNAFKKVSRGNPLTAKEEVDMALWRKLDDSITGLNPKVKDLTLDQSNLITARPGFKSSSGKTVGAPLFGLQSQSLEQGIQVGKDSIGRALLGSTTVKPMTARGVVGRVGGVGALRAGGVEPEPVAPMDDPLMGSPDASLEDAPQQSAISFEDALIAMQEDLATTGGKNIDKIEKIYKFANSQSGGGKPMSAEAAKVTSNADIGLQAIGDLEGTMQSNPGALRNTMIPGRGIAGGYLGKALGTQEIDAARQQIIDVIARLRTGAAITNEEASRFTQFLPVAADSPQVIEQKLGYLKRQFSSILSRTGGSQSSLEDALMQSGGYQ